VTVVGPAPIGYRATYARQQAISFVTQGKRALFKTPRERFRRGLERSLRVGAFFCERAARRPADARWQIAQLRTVNAMSFGGGFGVVTVGVTPSVTMIFDKEVP
jgi:hypothetical protein